MLGGFLGGLANLGGIVGGADAAADQDAQRRLTLMRIAELQQQRQLQQQEQQGLGLAAQGIRNYNPPIPQAPPQNQPMAGGVVSSLPPMPQPQSFGGGLASSLPPPSGAVKGSWFGNAPGWSDPSDSGLQASGLPVSAGPGIALPSRSTLGQQFDVTAPSGQTYTLPQTDVGPAKWTGRGVDINAPAAAAMGYTPKTFPTDQQFIVRAHRDLDLNVGQAGVGLIQRGLPVPAVKESTQIAKDAGREIDPQQWGMAELHTMMEAIDKANPDAPDAVKMIALGQLNKLIAPEERMQLQMYMKQNAQELQIGLAEFRAKEAERRAQEVTQRAATIEGMKEGFKAAQSDQGVLDPQTLSMMADQYLGGDRTVMQNLGRGAQGSKNIVSLRGEIAKKMAETGKSGQDIAITMAEFEGMKAGERTLSQRTANIGMRIAEAKTFAPLALQASDKVDRTQFPTLNSLLLAAEKGTGNEDVVRLSVATQSLLNAYAAAVTPTGTPTEGAQSRAHELLDKAWSQGQFRTAIDQLMKEMDAASKSPGTVREEFRKGAAAPTAGGSPVTGPPSGGIQAPAEGGPDAVPPVGTIKMYQGKPYSFKGGDQYDQKNWDLVQGQAQ